MSRGSVRCTVAHPGGATMQRETPEDATSHATRSQRGSLKAAAQRVLSHNNERNEPATKGAQRVQREGVSGGRFVARVGALNQAAEAANLAPDTLVALLSPEDHADLDAGLLTSDELAAYARSVSARWARGHVLADEAELAAAERIRRDPLAALPLLREDWMFIERCVVGRADRHDLLAGYRREWLAAAGAEPSEIKRDNAARRAANAWLREITGKGGRHGR